MTGQVRDLANKLDAAEQHLQRTSSASALVLDAPASGSGEKDTKLSRALKDV